MYYFLFIEVQRALLFQNLKINSWFLLNSFSLKLKIRTTVDLGIMFVVSRTLASTVSFFGKLTQSSLIFMHRSKIFMDEHISGSYFLNPYNKTWVQVSYK